MKKTQKIITYGGGILLAIITAMVLFLNGAVDYHWKLDQLLPNFVLLPIGLLLFTLVFFAGRAAAKGILKRRAGEKKLFFLIVLGAAVLFLLLAFLTHQYYFRTGWDADVLFLGALRLMSRGDLSMITDYLALYPNNALLVIVQAFVMKVNVILKIFLEMDGLYSLVFFQCGIVAAAGVVFYDVMRRLTGKTDLAAAGYCIYVLYFLSSPWTAIPYTDTVGLIVPLLVLELMLINSKSVVFTVLRYALIGMLTFVGYRLKPQLAILSIALVIVGLTKMIGKQPIKTAMRHLPAWGAFIMAFLLTAAALPIVEQKLLPVDIDEQRNMIPTHYIMMGLNTERDGAYIYSDVEISINQPTKALRQQENLRVIRERLKDMGAAGLFTHLVKKTLSCYADGTFFWGREGNFYQVVPTEKNDTLSPLLRNIFYNDGEYYAYWVLFRQAIWCAALLLACIGALSVRRGGCDTAGVAVIFLSIVGLTAFELLFESRARYLYSYVPIYLAAAMLGMEVLTAKVRKK